MNVKSYKMKKIFLLIALVFIVCSVHAQIFRHEIIYGKSNKKQSEGYLLNDVKIGHWSFYFENGNVWKRLFYIGDTTINELFREINMDSIIKSNKANINICSYERRIWYDEIDSILDTLVINIELPLVEYYEDGKLKIATFFESTTDTVRRHLFYPNGRIESEELFLNSYLNGLSVYYHENGRISKEGIFINSKREGNWTYYKKNGKLDKKITYHNDQIVKDY
jgi:uncharacterized protein